jgi:Uma2 family endonuclease
MEAESSQVSDGFLYMTVEQYIDLDESSDAKYEYLDGYTFMLRPPSSVFDEYADINMASESIALPALCARLGNVLGNALYALEEGPCRIYIDIRTKLDERRYLYPDVVIACSEQKGTMITNPMVVIEVVSKRTEQRDYGVKLDAYRASPSIQECMLVGGEHQSIEVHRREGTSWSRYHYRKGDQVELTSLGVQFPFDEVYRRILLSL